MGLGFQFSDWGVWGLVSGFVPDVDVDGSRTFSAWGLALLGLRVRVLGRLLALVFDPQTRR